MIRAFVIVALVALAGCMPTTIYRGHTPDRRHAIAIDKSGDVQWVVVDGVRRGAYTSIAAWSIASNADRIVFAASRGPHWIVVDRAYPNTGAWDAIGELAIDGDHTAFVAERAGRWSVVVDGRAGGSWDAVLARTLRVTGGRVVYVARDAAGAHVVVDGVAGPAWSAVGQLTIVAGRVAYAARRGDRAYVVVDGVATDPWDSVAKLALTTDGRAVYAAQDPVGWRVVIGAARSEPFSSVPQLVVDGDRVAFVARAGDADIVGCARDTVARTQHVIDGSLAIAGECDVAYAERDGTRTRVVHGTALASYDEVGKLVVSRGRVSYAARRGTEWQLVVGDRPIATAPWISDPVFSGDGSRLGYLAKRGASWVAVVDESAFAFEMVIDGTLAFSRDGRRWGVVAGDVGREQLFIAVDGHRRVPLAMTELYSTAGQADDLLRRWSAAEADK